MVGTPCRANAFALPPNTGLCHKDTVAGRAEVAGDEQIQGVESPGEKLLRSFFRSPSFRNSNVRARKVVS